MKLAQAREIVRKFRPLDCDWEYLEARNDPFEVPNYIKKVMLNISREIADLKTKKGP